MHAWARLRPPALLQRQGSLLCGRLKRPCLLLPLLLQCAHSRRARLEGAELAQHYALRLAQSALKRGQFVLCAEILRFLIPPRESTTGLLQWGPAAAGGGEPAAAGGGSGTAANVQPAAGGGGWFSWLWGGSAGQAQQAAGAAGADAADAAGGSRAGGGGGGGGSMSQAGLYRASLAVGAGVVGGSSGTGAPGARVLAVVADKAWALLEQVHGAAALCL